MTPDQVESALQGLDSGLESVRSAADLQSLEARRLELLGRKDGALTNVLKSLKDLSVEDKRRLGSMANTLRVKMEQALDERKAALEKEALQRDLDSLQIDLSLPGSSSPCGRLHPLTRTLDELCAILSRMGFAWAEGPHVETDFHNFAALNIPDDHPAKDSHDTFYLSPGSLLLRTHTSPVQIRTLQSMRPCSSVRIMSPGRVFRHENADASHSSVFHQVEGLYVDKNVSLADLKGTLRSFLQALFGPQTRMRLRPSFFPFTEPSAQVDIQCALCRGEGCAVCKRLGWLEVLGAGMVHPNVLRNAGYDPEIWSGYAWGLGVERIAMMRGRVQDIRWFYQNDVRFLEGWQ
ncbi:MAG: phenylalanine--tRNA ligase subunit alpha [Elusimicrobiota bacterium]|jgi:phenylalanyl-tRNA synthetase alpha chain